MEEKSKLVLTANVSELEKIDIIGKFVLNGKIYNRVTLAGIKDLLKRGEL